MARRKIENELEARRCLLAIEGEGGDIRTWARAHGVDGRSLHAWRVNFARWGKGDPARRRRRRGSARTATSTGLVELVPATVDQRVLPPSSSACRYVLEVRGTRVEFGDDFSEPTLRRVVGILRTC
jgi:hypothetical protein